MEVVICTQISKKYGNKIIIMSDDPDVIQDCRKKFTELNKNLKEKKQIRIPMRESVYQELKKDTKFMRDLTV